MRLKAWFSLMLFWGVLSACVGRPGAFLSSSSPVPLPLTAEATAQVFPSPTIPPTITPSPTQTPAPDYSLWEDPAVPAMLHQKVTANTEIRLVDQVQTASFRIEPERSLGSGEAVLERGTWIYALVAAFPTIWDGTTLADFQAAWQGDPQGNMSSCRLSMAASTVQALQTLFGAPGPDAIQVLPADQLLEQAWQDRTICAVVPFEELQPRWKVMRVDGISPYDRTFQTEKYPLAATFQLVAPAGAETWYRQLFPTGQPAYLPTSNRNPEKFSVVVLTGVTALVRATAWEMDTRGVLFPAETIGDVLRDADITHISNEVPFAPDCPLGDPNTASLRFCSRPEYLELLESVSTDVVELTGNHLEDWGPENLLYTLQLYKDHGLKYYAGGANLEEARKALLIEDHGNKFAFIGCNPAGPPHDWAGDDYPGSAPCDLDWEAGEIARLKSEGYLPIATFQYMEAYNSVPLPYQQRDFRQLADAGAVIVSGSQAHFPQAFEFSSNGLIHYGPGNLFFDQMNPIINGLQVPGTRREFIDRHIFYDGRYLGTDLVTAMLEDYARPRPMTADERSTFLKDIFSASGW